MKSKFLFIAILVIIFTNAKAQDTLVSTDNTTLIGEIKSMDKGVLSIETDFSDSDFKVSWLKVTKVISNRNFRFILKNKTRYYGTISVENGNLIIHDIKLGAVDVKIEDLVYMKQVDKGSVLDVMNLTLDLGYSFTNANDLEQINADFKADYYTNSWGVDGYFNMVQSTQTDVDPIQRYNGGLGLKYFAKYGIFVAANADYYSNNDQDMKLRSNYSPSVGMYFIRTNKTYFNSSVGMAYLIEDYIADSVIDRTSYEGKLALELNMFDIGDLNLLTSLNLFPSFSEKGRLRTQFKFDIKYDLPRDFYIRGGLSYNYDNLPAEGIDPNDYVYTFGFGWEL